MHYFSYKIGLLFAFFHIIVQKYKQEKMTKLELLHVKKIFWTIVKQIAEN